MSSESVRFCKKPAAVARRQDPSWERSRSCAAQRYIRLALCYATLLVKYLRCAKSHYGSLLLTMASILFAKPQYSHINVMCIVTCTLQI